MGKIEERWRQVALIVLPLLLFLLTAFIVFDSFERENKPIKNYVSVLEKNGSVHPQGVSYDAVGYDIHNRDSKYKISYSPVCEAEIVNRFLKNEALLPDLRKYLHEAENAKNLYDLKKARDGILKKIENKDKGFEFALRSNFAGVDILLFEAPGYNYLCAQEKEYFKDKALYLFKALLVLFFIVFLFFLTVLAYENKR